MMEALRADEALDTAQDCAARADTVTRLTGMGDDGAQIFTTEREHVGLVPQCARAKDLCFEFNCRTRPSVQVRQKALLSELLGAVGPNCLIAAPFMVDNGFNVLSGANFRSGPNLVILDSAPVTFGDNVVVCPNVHLTAVGHPLDATLRNQGIEYAYPITIGNNVVIGANTCILPGVTIGDNCVIGAGSVVNRSLPPGYLAAGNPCRPLRPITAAERGRYLEPSTLVGV